MPRDIGNGEIAGVDLVSELLKNGWAKLKELKRDPTEEDLRRRELEAEAKAAGKGIWNPHGPKVRVIHFEKFHSSLISDTQARQVHYMMPEDSQAFITEWKGKDIDGEGSAFKGQLLPLTSP